MCSWISPVFGILGENPDVFEVQAGGCAGQYDHGVNESCARFVAASDDYLGGVHENAVFLVRSRKPGVLTVREGLRRYGVVSYRDFIAQARQGLNSLRQTQSQIPRPHGVRTEAERARGPSKSLFFRPTPPRFPVLARACRWCLVARMWRADLP